MLTVLLTSESALKQRVLKAFLNNNYELITCATTAAEIPPQPVNSGQACAKARAEYAKEQIKEKYDLIVSIENEIRVTDGKVVDVCQVYFEDNNGMFRGTSSEIPVPEKYYQQALSQTPADYPLRELGLSVTIGEMITKECPDIDSKNWMGNRDDQITEALKMAHHDWSLAKLKRALILEPDFPKPGVLFQDLSKVLADPFLLQLLVSKMTDLIQTEISTTNLKIVGLDARGFIYGSLVAHSLKAGFVMARKKGKLPGETIEVSYGTEYSQACIEMLPGLIQKGDRVLIVDDLVATGGSLAAAVQLVEMCQGEVVGCLTVLQVPTLLSTAQEKLSPVPIYVLLD